MSATPTNDSPRASADGAAGTPGNAERSPWQFTLRELLVLMFAVSVVSALVAIQGPGASVLGIGVAVTLANSAGWLRRWQTPRAGRRWLGAGWLLFLVSLASPSAQGCNGKSILGGELAVACVQVQAEGVYKLATDARTRAEAVQTLRTKPVSGLAGQVFLLSVTAANVIALAAPLVYWLAWRRDRGEWLGAPLLAGGFLAWSMVWDADNQDMLFGYYLWCAALLLLACARRIPWRHQRIAWCILLVHMTLRFL